MFVCDSWFCLYQKLVRPENPQLDKPERKKEQLPETEKAVHVVGVRIFYGSQTGTAKVCITDSTADA